jgi:hypothetical protein
MLRMANLLLTERLKNFCSGFALKLHDFECKIKETEIEMRYDHVFQIWKYNYFIILISTTKTTGKYEVEFTRPFVDTVEKIKKVFDDESLLITGIQEFVNAYSVLYESETTTQLNTYPVARAIPFTRDFKSFCQSLGQFLTDFKYQEEEFTGDITIAFSYNSRNRGTHLFSVHLSSLQTPGVYVATFYNSPRMICSKSIATLSILAKAVLTFIKESTTQSVNINYTPENTYQSPGLKDSDNMGDLLQETKNLLDRINEKMKSSGM